MNYFIKKIHINNLYHLHNFDIQIKDAQTPHLIITGKNGSGKTVLLKAIITFLDKIKNNSDWINYKTLLKGYEGSFMTPLSIEEIQNNKERWTFYNDQIKSLFSNVELTFNDNDVAKLNKYNSGDFIISYYSAHRNIMLNEVTTPTKPTLNIASSVKESATNQFLNFLVDLKFQEVFAKSENQEEDVKRINKWFVDFENLLKQIFDDKNLHLNFDYKTYRFLIKTEGKEFSFTELSDGYAAILDIVVDLILKMQSKDNLTRAYQKEGIVLIDEVETHLHLELQKFIMPFLTKVFPNIQFIITTHSPFVLSSLDNAVAFDLEHREEIDELTQYSYSALAEGYFGVSSDSSYMQMQLSKLEEILKKENLSDQEIAEVKYIMADFEKIPEPVSPNLVGLYIGIKNKYASVIKKLPL